MIHKLQKKFVLIIMAITTLTFVCIFAAVNIIMYQTTEEQTLSTMERVMENDGELTPPRRIEDKEYKVSSKGEEPPISQNNFIVKLDNGNKITEIISDRNQNYTEAEIQTYVERVLKSGNKDGNIEKLKFLLAEKSYGSMIVFFDNTIQKDAMIRLMFTTSGVGIASLIFIFFMATYLSRWAIKPVEEAYEVQKRFVADASHELKTPLTIIMANADVLIGEIGDNKWLSFIKAEAMRMSELVNKLLYLAKSDAYEQAYERQEILLSQQVISTILPYESLFYEQEKQLILEIEEHIICKGDKNALMQVVVILLDNAIKNTQAKDEVKIKLFKNGNKNVLSVYNTGEGITPEEGEKIFDRFYRGDSSRARKTGSYGLGLAIAKTIVEAHQGRINVESKKGKWIVFTVTLPF